MNSITKRWVRGNLAITLAIVLVAELILVSYMVLGYYRNADRAVNEQLSNIRSQLDLFRTASSEEKNLNLFKTVEQYEEKAYYELMLVNGDGEVVMSSSGVTPYIEETPLDITGALRFGEYDDRKYIGKNENGEKVLAVTELTPYASGGIVAMRIVTSMTQVDGAIGTIIFVAGILLLLITLASVISGSYFIRSIVIPLRSVEETASGIAQGDLEARIVYKSTDEIGDLCNTINYMAEELGHTEQMKNEFISSVSHELRTPLTSIKGWTETMGQLRDPADPRFRRGMQIISEETDRLYDMVEELLDFSRMQSGVSLDLERLDLAAEVEDAVLLTMQRAARSGIAMDCNTPELPVPVMADKHRVRQVLLNVLDNAVKYSPPGGQIKVDFTEKEGDVLVTIADEGQGISPEDLKNVKVKFYKGQKSKQGSGIGLAVANGLMETHGGYLDIDSTLEEGTTVTLRFPLDLRNQEGLKASKPHDAENL